MIEVLVATKNKGKLAEIKGIVSISGVKLVSLLSLPEAPSVVEDGDTFEENATKKALTLAQQTQMYTLADDSGLEVEALDGKPGIFSARFARDGATDFENNQKLLELMENVPKHKRGARFRCVLAFASPEGIIFTTEGTCQGYITKRRIGEYGFGYDPLFARYEDHKTFAEIDSSVKCRISHRAKALEKASIHIESYFIRQSLLKSK